MTDHTLYESPLASRYASREMSALFSPYFKHLTWRKLWIALAKSQKKLGLFITDSQIAALEKHLPTIDFAAAATHEKKLRHDVMAHIHTYADQCPEAGKILHLGATSCFVTDNTDLIQMREALHLLQKKLLLVLRQLAVFARKNKSLACLSYTHLQAAQPTTVGKRACLWLQDFLWDFHDLEEKLKHFPFLGLKGATGTQASFLALFNGDAAKVKKLELLVAEEMGFVALFPISGQTYTRKQDMRILSLLTGMAASAHKCATDLRLLAHLKEIDEPFDSHQIGSSAMPYKRNPMRSERICGLSRFLISLNENPTYTAATQWLERTLDDSANRRLAISEAFLTADAVLNLLINVTGDLIIYPQSIARHLREELPFLALENILMEMVKRGKDRQEIHERLRIHSQEAAKKMKEEGLPCDLLERISRDKHFGLSLAEIEKMTHAEHFIGRAPEQVEEFLCDQIDPLLKRYEKVDLSPPKIDL